MESTPTTWTGVALGVVVPSPRLPKGKLSPHVQTVPSFFSAIQYSQLALIVLTSVKTCTGAG